MDSENASTPEPPSWFEASEQVLDPLLTLGRWSPRRDPDQTPFAEVGAVGRWEVLGRPIVDPT